MRTISILLILSFVSVAAGAASAVAFLHDSLPLGTTIISSLVVATLAFAGTFWMFQKSFSNLHQQASSDNSQPIKSRIHELATISHLFAERIQTAESTSVSKLQELQAVKQLVSQIDQRKIEFDREGNPIDPATQLRSVLKGQGGELHSNLQQTLGCVREIKRATQDLVSGSEQQSDSVNQATSLIEKLSSQILFVCDHSELALKASTQVQENAESSTQQFNELVAEMKNLLSRSAARERKLKALGQHTNEIELIVQAIGTLSSRTDLLALNASIESVRAGEQGRGFAIVAEEVRALAEQSAQAVKDISGRIELIQTETQQSISVATTEHSQLRKAIDQVTDTIESLEETSAASLCSATNLDQVTSSSRTQLELAREIVRALEQSAETSRAIRSQAEGVSWTTNSLTQIGDQFQDSLAFFSLAESNSQPGLLPPAEIQNRDSSSKEESCAAV